MAVTKRPWEAGGRLDYPACTQPGRAADLLLKQCRRPLNVGSFSEIRMLAILGKILHGWWRRKRQTTPMLSAGARCTCGLPSGGTTAGAKHWV